MASNEISSAQLLESVDGQMNMRGQVIIPAPIRKFIEHLFAGTSKLALEIQYLSNGTIQLIPTAKLRLTSFMEQDPTLMESVGRALSDQGPERLASKETIDKLLED